MRKLIAAFVVLTAAPMLFAQDTAELRARNEVLEADVKRLKQRIDQLEADVQKLRIEYAREMQETIDRLARLESALRDRMVSRPPKPIDPNDDPFSNLRGDDAPKPRADTPKRSTDDRPAPRPATDDRNPSRDDKSPEPLITDNSNPPLARADTLHIPDPVIPTPRPRPKPVGSRPKGLPTPMAVVNMVDVFEALKEKDRIEEGLGDLIYAVQFEDQKWRRRIGGFQADLATLEKGSLAYEQKVRQVEEARIEWGVALAATRQKLERRRGELTGKLYAKMVEAVGRVADANGYEIVLFKEPQPDYYRFESMAEFLSSRLVVRVNNSVDLTDQVVRLMNREYEVQGNRTSSR